MPVTTPRKVDRIKLWKIKISKILMPFMNVAKILIFYERCKDTDFSRAKKVCEIPELQKFQDRLRAQKTYQSALNAVIRALFT